MLGYEWATHSSPPPQLMLSDVVDHQLHHHHDHHHHHNNHNHVSSSSATSEQQHHHHRSIFDDPFSSHCTFPHDNTSPSPNTSLYNPPQIPFFNDPRAFQGASYQPHPMLTLDSLSRSTGFNPVIPKAEPEQTNRPIGLNLGGRTYFSPDDDLVSRLYRRSRGAETAANSPRCQAEGCNADLTNAKHYHRRHKVCEFHSKASTVIAAGLTQRFCQQCSRFHLLSEFDNGKRSCRKRLADHNRRRRKSHQMTTPHDHRTSPMSENAQTSPSQNIQRSPTSDSGMNSTSSVTIAASPPRVSFESNFRQRLYE